MSDAATIPSWEDQLPPVQMKINRFCENWIFAFIVAMAIRHFVVEPFRIPSASMEPALYGDIALGRSDFVVVDKLFCRFRAVKRFDVTVFQFPHPEISGPGGSIITAYDAADKRRDSWLTRPPVYRNFVKRAVVLPGERFYIANGDIFVADAQGTFAVARKPAAVQEEVWGRIYTQGAQTTPEVYLPWKGVDGATVTSAEGSDLTLTLTPTGSVAFTQPFRNLYFKPGPLRVEPRFGSKGPQLVDVALDRPLFTYNKKLGNAWDLDDWNVKRVTTADLDNPAHGAELNAAMHERIGDVRVAFRVDELNGRVRCELAEGTLQALDLDLVPDAWRLLRRNSDGTEEELATASGATVGSEFSLANIDDEVVLVVNGVEVVRAPVAAADPEIERLAWTWSGEGRARIANCTADRDLHYCANGFLKPETLMVAGTDLGTQSAWKRSQATLRSGSALAQLDAAKHIRHERDVRAQMLHHEVTDSEATKPIGYSAETAITAPDNGYLLMGDNSPMSWDARNWGWVPAANIRGRVVLRIRAKRFGESTYIPFLDWSWLH
jgi:signal peptidase I